MTRRKNTDKGAFFSETCAHAARTWVLAGEPTDPHYEYINGRWVMVSFRYNGEEAPPRRRAEDKESDYLAPDEAAIAKRLEDLTSDRSADA